MFFKPVCRGAASLILVASWLAGCASAPAGPAVSTTPAISKTTPISPTNTNPSTVPHDSPPSPFELSNYAFPDAIDPAKQYLFYLHGKIVEDQGIPAISPDYGEYQYGAILEAFGSYGFQVISEQRPKDTDGVKYASRVSQQVAALLNAGVPAGNITVVGASRGAGITIYVSHYLEEEINYVLLAICHPDRVASLVQGGISLHGNVLSIYDSVDEYAGSCQELFAFSEGKGISRHDEIVLEIGTGHGVLYQPLDEWIIPVVEWAGKP